MNSMQKDQIRYELVRAIGALQDAFAYAQHAELLCREYNAHGDRMRVGGLRQQINSTIDHAVILRQSIREYENEDV